MNDTRNRSRSLRAGSRPSFLLGVDPEILTKIPRHADSATTRHYIMLKSRKHGQTAMRKLESFVTQTWRSGKSKSSESP